MSTTHQETEAATALAQRLEALRAVASGTEAVFGSSTHKWKSKPPLTEDKVAALEAGLGVTLPTELRAWLLNVAASGAGPFYGLLPIAAPPKKSGTPSATFRAKHKAGAGIFDGSLVLADEGCGLSSVLVVTGRSHGQIWTLDAAGRRTRQEATFFEWLDRWLVRASLEWAERYAFEWVTRGERSLVLDDLAPRLEALIAHDDAGRHEALVVLAWARVSQGRFDDALALAERAAAAFIDVNVASWIPEQAASQARERLARGHLYRARIRRLAGRPAEALLEAEAGLALHRPEARERIWLSTYDELLAERAVLGGRSAGSP